MDFQHFSLYRGDCIDGMRKLRGDSIDAVVTDPPYGLGFMGKGWDHAVPGAEFWVEALRVAKPGAHLAAFGGTRTFHRLACAIEDAGWELRDTLMWVYGSGFPKPHNGPWGGTNLKPAWEPIILARKPFDGTVASNYAAHGTGGLNLDSCGVGSKVSDGGRFPANLIHDGSDDVLAAFPYAKGQQGPVSGTAPSEKTSNSYGRMKRKGEASADSNNEGAVGFRMKPGMRRSDDGSAARFFYCAKASKADRGEGNNHPTVKPTELMRYLCRLVTPPGGLVLDPFMGSGSTGRGAMLEGLKFIGMELDENYTTIAKARILHALGTRTTNTTEAP